MLVLDRRANEAFILCNKNTGKQVRLVLEGVYPTRSRMAKLLFVWDDEGDYVTLDLYQGQTAEIWLSGVQTTVTLVGCRSFDTAQKARFGFDAFDCIDIQREEIAEARDSGVVPRG